MKKSKINEKAKKQFLVVGLGRFGKSVAASLEESNCNVMVIDRNEKNINAIADKVTHAVCMDITDEDAVAEIGIGNFDVVIVSMGHNLEAAIFAVMLAKEHGVKKVIAKAMDDNQGKVLKKVGADMIVNPERDMATHLAKTLAIDNFLDSMELSKDYSIAEINVPKDWIGKSLIELKPRDRYGINVMGLKRNGELNITPNPDDKFLEGDTVIIIGPNKVIPELVK